ncbi:MAG: penicillin-binding protein 1C [Rhizobacter sp.]|nr:penicillin-binding protein 1C [Bacteriovorax sp.]
MRKLLLTLSFVLVIFSNAHAGISKKEEFQTFSEIKNAYVPSDVMIVDRYGRDLERFRNNKTERSLPWVSLNEVSYAFKTLLLKSEDKNFYEHAGVDWKALMKAGFDHLTKNTRRGASTLSMQLVGLIDSNVSRHRRTFSDKYDQVKKALYLEEHWSKEEILEAYINLTAFRGELLGLGSASFGYFNKSPGTLTLEESSLLVALLRSPNADAELVGKRACQLLETTSCLNVQDLAMKIFSNGYEIKRERNYLSVIDKSFLKKNGNKNIIQTTIDKTIQNKAVESLQEQIRFYKEQNVNDGAILVLDNQTGEVVTYVPNAGVGFSKSPGVDGVRSRRQAGSTLKPFVYATAIDLNLIDQNSLIDDSPVDISVGNGSIYYPKNYDDSFKGLVTAAEALGSSLNVPAVKTLQLVGGEKVVARLKKLGFRRVRESSYYGPSLALGSVDITLWDLTHAYQKLIKDKVFSAKTRTEIFQMLSRDENRRFTFGTGSILQLPFPAAVKTGTSKDMRDNWCVGFSERYTVGVWVGNFNGKAMWNVSGVTGAAPLWRAVMMELHKGSTESVRTLARVEAVRTNGTEIFKKNISSIRYPVNQEVVGFDSEIPQHLQKMPFEISNPQSGSKLFLNEKFYAEASELAMWPVERGQYHLALYSADQKLIDEVRFEVR